MTEITESLEMAEHGIKNVPQARYKPQKGDMMDALFATAYNMSGVSISLKRLNEG